jgi:hypothetical protein
LTHLRISSPQIEGILQASKWLKVQVLLDPEELEHLFATLAPCHLLNIAEPVESGNEEISLTTLHQGYRAYIESLKQGTPLIPRSLFSCALSRTLDPFYAFSLPNGKSLVKPTLPVIQLQAHTFFYSSFDRKFHPMVQGKESISWGLQFSYPQLYQNPHTKEIHKATSDNSALFSTLMQWMRSFSLPTPFCVEGTTSAVPIRIGKKAGVWINRHLQLQSHGISVNFKRLCASP